MSMSTLRRALALIVALLPAMAGSAHADGNVSAVVQNGLLILRGDNADNQVRMTTDGAPAGGVTLLPRINTTINGQLVAFAGPALFSGGTGKPDSFNDEGTNEYATPLTVAQFEQ
jgi:hypothetical protein